MPKLIENPSEKNHYDYLNELLKLNGNHKLSSEKQLHEKESLLKKIQDKMNTLKSIEDYEKNQLLLANLNKLQTICDFLEDDEVKAAYDEALKTGSKLTLKAPDSDDNHLVCLVDPQLIIDEFNNFISELKKTHPDLDFSQFTYEVKKGNPTVYTFNFPDEETKNTFVARLFQKNMVAHPPRPQPSNERHQKQADIKSKLQDAKAAAKEVRTVEKEKPDESLVERPRNGFSGR